MPARSVCLVTLSLSEAGPERFGRQVSVTDIYHTIPCTIPYHMAYISRPTSFSSVQLACTCCVPYVRRGYCFWWA